jgi:hypothetical protein
VERCVRRLRETAEVEIVCAVDHDLETFGRLWKLVDHLDYSHPYRGCSRAWNDCLRHATGDPVVFAADDLDWQPGWLPAALYKLEEFPDSWGLVGFNDGHWGEELSTHYLMSRRFIVDVLGGVVAWPEYGHSFNDLEVNERARRVGRYAWCEEAKVFHDHWLFGDRAQDDTDRRTLADHAAAQATFERRKAQGFPNDHDPVITTWAS